MKQLNQTGIVFMVTMIFLIVLSWLGVHAMETAQLQQKMSNNWQLSQMIFQAAEAGLREGERLVILQQQPDCFYKQAILPNQLLKKPGWWFENTTCQLVWLENEVKFVIEHLIQEPCTKVDEDSKIGADYFRITTQASNLEQGVSVVLQTTVALPSLTTSCTIPLRNIHYGRQSWRQLV